MISVTFVAINCVYVKFVTKVQTVLTVTKLLALLLVIVCGLVSLGIGKLNIPSHLLIYCMYHVLVLIMFAVI